MSRPGAAFMLASSIQNAHSGADTMISALGKTRPLSLSLMPLMWSGWKCEMTMRSTAFGSMPAAARLSPSTPADGAIWPPVPVSTSTSLLPVLTTKVVNGVASLSAGMNAAASALAPLRGTAHCGRTFGDRPVPDAVIERGQLEGADPVAVNAGRLLAGGRLRGSGQIGAPGKGGGSSRAGKEVAARQFRHGVSVLLDVVRWGRGR